MPMPDEYCVAGIDQSLSSTGLVVLYNTKDSYSHKNSAICSEQRGVLRLFDIEKRIKDLIPQRVSVIAMEGYAYKGRGAVFGLGELGGCIKMLVYRASIRLLIVPPSTLKKFVTGSGVAPKNKMMLGVYKKWGVEFETDDEADAYALARAADMVLRFENGVELSKIDQQVCKSIIKHTNITLHEENENDDE